MYQALQKSALIRVIAAIGAVAMLIAWFLMNPDSPSDYIRMVSFAATGAGVLITILGASPLWKFLWWIFPPLNRWVFPNISGVWEFRIESNIEEIAKRHPELKKSLVTPFVTGKIVVKQTLFSMGFALNSASDYSISDTIVLRPSRDEETDRFYITLVYQNRTPKPLKSDEQMHLGAARIEIVGVPKNMQMNGVYWTNRNWQRGLNTAGEIFIRRPSEAS